VQPTSYEESVEEVKPVSKLVTKNQNSLTDQPQALSTEDNQSLVMDLKTISLALEAKQE